jgi:dihydroorotase
MKSLTITRPDDWHLHLRDDAFMASVVGDTAKRFARAMVMPNLKPPVITAALALAYRERILARLPSGLRFEPLMSLYLTDNTSAEEIAKAVQTGLIKAVKYYPAGATTHSDAGVTDLSRCHRALEAMQNLGLPLLVHGEVTDANVDIFDRERMFIDGQLKSLISNFPELKIVFEHITTREAVQFVSDASPRIAATITAHHLLLNRNALFSGGLRPHNYCLPILKKEPHRLALIHAATHGNVKFFLGTDSAPHTRDTKQSDCGCAGCYTAYAGIELYAEAFDAVNALDKLEGFASHFGPDFYGLPRNEDTITLELKAWTVPLELPFGEDQLTPFLAGSSLRWRLKD